ncbi:MAG: pyridoxal phosphate-dependent aminotransferase [Xanthomonadales bacterium]|nr:pyridoxal phosphate-dependent aminotransferase [Xanthomonadales bacterium]
MYETAATLQSAGIDVIHLEVGRPSSVTPAHIREAAKTALDNGIVHYGDLQGLAPLREALATRYCEERNVNYEASEILITNGVTQASYAAFMSALDEGDEVIVLDPFYPQHNSKIRLAGGTVVQVPLSMIKGMYRLDANRLEDAITATTRMIVLINPANPVGTVYTREELEQIAQLAEHHDLLVLSDEVYEYIIFDDCTHISFASLPGMKERTITVNAFTKAYAMDGWRIGYAAAPEHMISVMRQVTMNTTTHPCVFAQEGALVAVTGPQDCVRAMVAEDCERRDLVVETLNSIKGITCNVPQGTIYAFPDISGLGIGSDELALKILQSAHVAVESGAFYGRQGEGHLRVCFGSEKYERLAQGMQRLKASLG